MSIIIAFGGAKGSGKSTASSFLVKHHDYVKGSFATKLKELITNLFNLTDECYNVDKKEKVIERLGTTPRKLLQTIGTELFRNTLPSVLPEYRTFLRSQHHVLGDIHVHNKLQQHHSGRVV